jgi:stringent starvation protein B
MKTGALLRFAVEAGAIVAGATQGIVGEKSPYYFRTFFTIPQVSRPMAQWAHKNGVKKVVVMVADFAPGHDAESSFSKPFTDLGGTVTSTIRVPLRSPEFSSYMQRIKDAKADAVFVFLPLGELCVQFLKAYSDSGLATSGLKLGNDFIEFKARFSGSARGIMVPVNRVLAIYARENGQGMAFPLQLQAPDEGADLEGGLNNSGAVSSAPVKTPRNLNLTLSGESTTPTPPPKSGGKRPALKRVK